MDAPAPPKSIPYSNKSKLKDKNEAIYRKIERCLDIGNHYNIIEILKLSVKRPDFDYFFSDNLIIKELLKDGGLIVGDYERDWYWKFYFEHVFNEEQKLKYAKYAK